MTNTTCTECQKCKLLFPQWTDYMKHRPTCRYRCTRCEETFLTKGELAIHTNSLCYYTCTTCQHKFTQLPEYTTHINRLPRCKPHNSDHINNQKPHTCTICCQKFKYESHLITHQKQPHQCQYRCPTCHIHFENKITRHKHVIKQSCKPYIYRKNTHHTHTPLTR